MFFCVEVLEHPEPSFFVLRPKNPEPAGKAATTRESAAEAVHSAGMRRAADWVPDGASPVP
jgi:hypothetical protein